MFMSGEAIGRAATLEGAMQIMQRRAVRLNWQSNLTEWTDWT